MLATDRSKQQALDAGQKEILQINFTGNLENNSTIFSIIEETKKSILNFSQGTMTVLSVYFVLVYYNV